MNENEIVFMKSVVTSLTLLPALLFQSLFGGSALVTCLHHSSDSGHLSYLHSTCPNNSTDLSLLQLEETSVGENDSDCVDIVLDFLISDGRLRRFLSSSLLPLLASIPARVCFSSLSAQTIYPQKTTAWVHHAAPQFLTGTVILTC